MSRTQQTAVKTALALSISALVLSQAAFAAPAPIRYGHGAGERTSSQPSGSPAQYAALDRKTASSKSVRDDLFFYPDEPVYLGDSSPTPRLPLIADNSEQNHTVSTPPVVLPDTSGITREEYLTYAKFGKPYKIAGKTYYPAEDPFYNRTGMASWYGEDFHGNLTANGEIYDMMAMTAAHPTLPLPSYVLVTNEENGRQAVLRVNDRGPFKKNRLIDVSMAAAEKLDMIGNGTAKVRVEYIGMAEKAGAPPRRAVPNTGKSLTIADVKTEPAAAAPPRAPVPNLKDLHFVQIGSFASRENAYSLLQQAAYGAAQGDVVFANVNGAGRYRVVLGPFSSRTEAETANYSMTQSGFEGFVIRNP